MINTKHDFIVFDLELTKNSYGLTRLIEIGAVRLNENLLMSGDSFQTFVDPNCKIEPDVIALTGITDKDVANAPCGVVAIDLLKDWIEKTTGKPVHKSRLVDWGGGDVAMLRHECQGMNWPYPFAGQSYDFKTLALMWKAISGKRIDRETGLKSFMDLLGLTPIGNYHRALVDAEATAQVGQKVISLLQHGVYIDNNYYSLVKG